MRRWLRHAQFLALLTAFAGCAGSCSGCESCGITPLPGGFPAAQRIDNAAAVRVTPAGLSFVSANLGTLAGSLLGGTGSTAGGVLTFEVPESSQSITVVTATICSGGPDPTANPPRCIMEANLAGASLPLTTAAPSNITVVNGTLPARLANLPVSLGFLGSTQVRLNNGGSCTSNDFANLRVNANISIETDVDAAHGSRKGTSKIRVLSVDIDQGVLTDSLAFCGGAIGSIINLLKGVIAPLLIDPLIGQVTGTIEDQLCMKEDLATGVTCPDGSTPDAGGTCMYADGACAGSLLGLEGSLDLGTMLASLSPGAQGGVDFSVAVGGEGVRPEQAPCEGRACTWGDLNPTNGNLGLGMFGGAEPTAVSGCVPQATLTRPTGIPIPDELIATDPSWPGGLTPPHVGIGVAERYINHMLGGIYNSGGLCLGIGQETFGSLLNSDTIGLLVGSFKDLGRQRKAQPVAITLRPQTPPVVTVGNGSDIDTDPLLSIKMDQLEIDFYIFSSDRFIRAFTATFDVTVPVNLDVTSTGALAPVVGNLGIANANLINVDLIREDPQTAAEALAGVVAGQIGSALGGAIAPIDLSSQTASLGLTLTIPPSVPGQGSPGLRRLEKGSDRFLGIFASLGIAAPTPYEVTFETETRAELIEKRVLPEGLSAFTVNADNRPRVVLRLDSESPLPEGQLEHSWRLNGGLWHAWQTGAELTVEDPSLSLQAWHRVEVRSRVVGEPASVDRTPSVLEFAIDGTAPFITLGRQSGPQLEVDVRDLISEDSEVLVRWALDGGQPTEWLPAAGLTTIAVGEASDITVEAKDEEGNVATSRQALVRGRADASLADPNASGCACTVPGAPTSSGPSVPGYAAALGVLALALRGRRRAAPGASRSSQEEVA